MNALIQEGVGALGLYFTALSILVVYHMFMLQSWSEAVTGFETAVEESRSETAVLDLARERLRRRGVGIAGRFPWLGVILIGICLAWLIWLSVRIGMMFAAEAWVFTVSPAVVLGAVYVVATVLTRIEGGRRLARAKNILG